MNYNESLGFVQALLRFGTKPGLERIEYLLSLLDNPQDSLKCIHVAGTNGKGSTSAMITESLGFSGYKTGFFTSPYVVDFCERIQVGGKYISRVDFANIATKLRLVCEKIPMSLYPTEFEFITAAAFLYFAECGVEVAVIETGLGGRYDSTNVIKKPLASVITRIDIDHTAVLGDTIEEIAYQKSGIIKRGAVVIVACEQEHSALKVIRDYSNEEGAQIIVCDVPEFVRSDVFGNEFEYKGSKYGTAMLGEHQICNAVSAIETLTNCGLEISKDDIANGLKTASLPARQEVLCKDPVVILDGSHNPNGTDALRRTIDNLELREFTAIVGMMGDKDIKKAMANILPLADCALCVEVTDNPRALKSEDLKVIAQEFCSSIAMPSYDQAIELAVIKKRPIIIFGSLYLASGIRRNFLNRFKD